MKLLGFKNTLSGFRCTCCYYLFWNEILNPILFELFIVCIFSLPNSKTVITTSLSSIDLIFIKTTSVGKTENLYISPADRCLVSFFVLDPQRARQGEASRYLRLPADYHKTLLDHQNVPVLCVNINFRLFAL